MQSDRINFKDKFAKFSESWSPKVIAELNDYQFKLARFEGEFIWHDHQDTDEGFIVIEGSMSIEMRDKTVHLRQLLGTVCGRRDPVLDEARWPAETLLTVGSMR